MIEVRRICFLFISSITFASVGEQRMMLKRGEWMNLWQSRFKQRLLTSHSQTSNTARSSENAVGLMWEPCNARLSGRVTVFTRTSTAKTAQAGCRQKDNEAPPRLTKSAPDGATNLPVSGQQNPSVAWTKPR